MLIIAALIRLDSPGPALYGQRRIGRNGRPFTCYKFRSMRVNAHDEYDQLAASATYTGDRVAFKMKNDPRVTRIGRWLRSTSLDELPNLFNVLRGEMSLVGPRPHVPEEVAQVRAVAPPAPGDDAGPDLPLAGQRAQRPDVR